MLEHHKAYTYKVTIKPKTMSAAISFPCEIGLIYKKGGKKLESSSLVDFSIEKQQANFQEKMSFESIYIKNTQTNTYMEEFNFIKVFMRAQSKNKNLGMFKYNPANLLNKGKNVFVGQKHSLLKCPDPDAYLTFDISFLRLNELDSFELK